MTDRSQTRKLAVEACLGVEMFTGLIQGVGMLRGRAGDSITVDAPPHMGGADDPWKIGESIALNGCCLTLVRADDGLVFELSPETFAKTTFDAMPTGSQVNLERALRVGDRLGGHIVQGHVDGFATCTAIHHHENHHEFVFEADPGQDRYFIEKGSIALDGISLTIVAPVGNRFSCWIIPTTFRETNLGTMQVGQRLHVEVDMIAKHVERLLGGKRDSTPL